MIKQTALLLAAAASFAADARSVTVNRLVGFDSLQTLEGPELCPPPVKKTLSTCQQVDSNATLTENFALALQAAKDDETIPTHSLEILYSALKGPKSLIARATEQMAASPDQ